jgi:hypothetical protein
MHTQAKVFANDTKLDNEDQQIITCYFFVVGILRTAVLAAKPLLVADT